MQKSPRQPIALRAHAYKSRHRWIRTLYKEGPPCPTNIPARCLRPGGQHSGSTARPRPDGTAAGCRKCSPRNDERQPEGCLFIPHPVLASKPRDKGHRIMVRTERLELSHLAAPEPKSGVSTNFTTSAFDAGNENARHLAWRFRRIWGGRWESNPRHQEPQSCALPTELRPPYFTLLAPRLPNGTPGRTRTCDHPLRRRMLYPAELRALDHLPEQTLRSFRLQQKP